MNSKFKLKNTIALLALLLLAMMIFRAIYIYDNKYTYPCPRAVNGILTISKDDIASGRLVICCQTGNFIFLN